MRKEYGRSKRPVRSKGGRVFSSNDSEGDKEIEVTLCVTRERRTDG